MTERAIKTDDVAASYIGKSAEVPAKPTPVGQTKSITTRDRKRRPTTLAKLVRECPSAAIVWIALLDLAGGRMIVTPTRQDIANASGIDRLPTISKALSALESCGWIDRILVPFMDGGRRTATGIRIVIRRERKAFFTGATTVKNGKRSKGKERKTFQDSPTERGVAGHAGGVPSPLTPRIHPADDSDKPKGSK